MLLWLPLYLAVATVDGLGSRRRRVGRARRRRRVGLGLPYVRSALLSSFAIGAAGLVALHLHLRREFPRRAAFLTTLLVFAATPLYWYMVYEPSMTHAASFGFVALFVVCSARWVPQGATVRQSLILGTLIGLAFLARSQEALFALYPAVLVLSAAGTPPGGRVCDGR